ncbi:MAG TPA: hypothetical protein GX734_03985 [Clostridiaceae bacterium]|nr:hypothetical protein [Clostridiaceae bacterium]
MDIFLTIIGAVVIVAFVFFLIVVIPIIFGKLFLRWSGKRMRYVFSESLSTILAAVIGSLVLTGLILLIGLVFKKQWAFSGGLLLVYTFWIAIKVVRENIWRSRGL